jgi:Fe-S cluster assembly protein SufD
MSTSPLATRIAEEHAAVSGSLPGEIVSRKRRREAIDALLAHGLPGPRDESWKYANLRPLERVRFAPAEPGSLKASDLPAPVAGFARYTFLDGVLLPGLCAESPVGVTIRTRLSQPQIERLPRRAAPPGLSDERLALLNDAFATDAAAIRVAAAAEAPRLELLFVASADASSGASYPRVELEVEPGGKLVLIERHLSIGSDASFSNSAFALDIARGGVVHHYRWQQSGSRSLSLDTLSAVLAGSALYRLHSVALGALSSRSTVHVQLLGEASEVTLSAASVADRQQVQDVYALVEHVAPRTRTEQTFRGISAGRARVGFNGKVIVQKGAHGTDSRQSLRGLLAGPEAEIDVRPQLEIYTDDVRCSHGATAGKLDDSMLFYLLSRGLDRQTAQQLLKWAFLEDVVSRIEVPELRRQIEQSLAGQMTDAAALKELL